MKIPASELLDHFKADTVVSVRQSNGVALRECSLDELRSLVADESVVGIANAQGELREVRLLVPAKVAFRSLGERRKPSTRGVFPCAANITVVRSSPTSPH